MSVCDISLINSFVNYLGFIEVTIKIKIVK